MTEKRKIENTIDRLESKFTVGGNDCGSDSDDDGDVPKECEYKCVSDVGLNIRINPIMGAQIVGRIPHGEIIRGSKQIIVDTSGNQWVRHARGFSMFKDVEGTNGGGSKPGQHFLVRI